MPRFAFLLLLLVSLVHADEYDALRVKWKDAIVGAGYDILDPDVAARLASIASAANTNWSSMDKTPTRTFLWSDLASTAVSSHVTATYSRLRRMALAYATPGCSLHGDATLLADIVGGLDWMHAHRYGATTAQYDNWWDWEIGTPLQLTDIGVLLYDGLTAAQLANYMNAVEHQVPTPDMTQANKVWKARAVGVRGCLVKSSAKLVLCRDAFSAVFPYVTSGDGYYTDGSFIQHDYHPYTAGYGASLIATMAPVLNWLSGSAWAVTDPAQSNLFHWVFDSYEPIIYRGNVFDLVRGREAGRSNASPNGQGMMDSILQIAEFAPPADAARMQSMVKEWALSDSTREFVSSRGLPTLMLAKNLMNDAAVVGRGELLAHYTFGEMDRVIHLGAGYGFGLTMCSTRIANFESINGENLMGWFTGDGQTTIYNGDLTAFADAYQATVDHYRLPGVTADVSHVKLPHQSASIGPRAQGQSTRSPHSWVGGATLGRFGAAGMQFKGAGVTLTGKKSWFMFDDEIVCLGSGITSTDGRPIETTVEQRKLNTAGDNAFTVNGSTQSTTLGWAETMTAVNWAHLAGNVSGSDIGCFFPTAPALKGLREARTGAWSDIDSDGSTAAITRNYLRMTIEHGSNPADATYQYVLLPGRNATRTGHYAAAPQVTVLANSAHVQAVTETTLGITAANFWTDTAQTIGGITSNKKASVLVRDDGPFIDVSVSDPTQLNTGTIDLQIALDGGTLASADPGLAVTQSTPGIVLSVSTANAAGKTFKARFYKLTPQILNLAPVADAYVYDAAGSRDSNFGNATSLVVKKSGIGYNRESFLRFEVPASSGILLGASLKLPCLTVDTPGVHGVAKVADNAWSEAGITWNNQPAAGAVLSTWTPAALATSSGDVSRAVPASGPVSFKVSAITQTSNGYVTYGSRENSTAANRPQLSIALGHTPPEISLTSPADGSVSRAGPATLTADAIATDGAITRVDFYDGATLLGTGTTFPYSVTPTFQGGPHLLTAAATDANGLTRTSLPIRMDVAYPPVASPATLTTPQAVPIDVDLRTLVSDADTPLADLCFALGSATNGSVALLAGGHIARFTPDAGYTGPASFGFTVHDTTPDSGTWLNWDHLAVDRTANARHGSFNNQGTGASGSAEFAPAVLAPQITHSIRLTENGPAGGSRVERSLATLDPVNADWTIAGWFNRDSTANIDSILQIGESGGWGSNALSLVCPANTTIELRNYAGATNDLLLAKSGVAAGVWHHFAIVRSGTTIQFFLDGSLAGSDSDFTITIDPNKPLKFGGVGPATNNTVLERFLNGHLADLAVFDTALSPADAATLAQHPVRHLRSQTSSSTVTLAILTPVESWRQQHFGTIAGAGDFADTADIDRDGLPNLLEYAGATDPNSASAALEAVSRNGSSVEFTYTKNKSATDVTFAVEWSDTLTGTWSTAGVASTIVSDTATVQQVQATLPAGTTGRRFVRLRVTRP